MKGSHARVTRRTVLPLVGTGVAVFVGVCTVLYLLQEQLIFLRTPLADGDRRAVDLLPNTEEIEITAADGTRLHGWLRHPTDDTLVRGLILYFGGNAEEVSGQMHDAEMLAPWSFAAINYRGYGLSEGRPSEASLVADARVIYDWFAQLDGIDPNRIVVFGRSLGTGVAVQLAASRPVHAVVLISPFDSLRSIARSQYPLIPVSLLLKHPFDSLARVPAIHAPALVLAGADDRLVPPRLSRRLYDAWAGAKRWISIPDADHNDLHVQPGYWSAIRAFLNAPSSEH
ncbi:MAG: alpha/beta hydrolase [Rhodospirillales bacterium]|nr:alpha/beta hydrolase [Rhodospirillales bacterium]